MSWRERALATPWPLTLAVAILVALPILAQGELSAADTRSRVRDDQLAATSRVAAQGAANLDASIAQIRNEVVAVSTRAVTGKPTPFIDALERDDVSAIQAQMETMWALMGGQVVVIRVYSASGENRYRIRSDGFRKQPPGPTGLGANDSDQPWWGRVTASSPVDISPVFLEESSASFRGATGAEVAISVFVPRVTKGEPAIVNALVLAPRTAVDTLQPLFQSVNEFYVVDQDGRLVLRSSRAFVADPDALRDLSAQPAVKTALGAKTVSFEGDDPYGNGRRFIASATMPTTGWRVIATQTTGAIERELDAALLQQRGVRGILAILLIVVTFLLARSASQVVRQRRELAATNLELARANQAKSTFLASMSHELRTPMNAILGFTDALLAGVDGALNDGQRESLGYVQRGGQDLLALINEILDLSKIEAGKLVITPEPFDPRELLEIVVQQYRSLAAGKGVRLSWRDDGMPSEVVLDRQRTRQIVVNLCGNALKFTDRGEVEVIGSGDAEDRLRLAVRDTGAGIPAGQLEAIFEEFRQVEGTVGGTGLGLPISRRLARLMGGNISVESELGKGSVFSVDLPRDCRAPAPAERELAAARGTGRLLLAVDDDPSVGRLLEKMLAGRAYRVAAPSPAAAVAEARRLRPNVITLDVLMPERSGHDILRELRSDPATRDIPIITLSVVDPAEAPQGADAHLMKPLKKDRLLRALDEVERVAAGKV